MHSSILAWGIPWTEEPGSWSLKELHMAEQLSTYSHNKTYKTERRLRSNKVSSVFRSVPDTWQALHKQLVLLLSLSVPVMTLPIRFALASA